MPRHSWNPYRAPHRVTLSEKEGREIYTEREGSSSFARTLQNQSTTKVNKISSEINGSRSRRSRYKVHPTVSCNFSHSCFCYKDWGGNATNTRSTTPQCFVFLLRRRAKSKRENEERVSSQGRNGEAVSEGGSVVFVVVVSRFCS